MSEVGRFDRTDPKGLIDAAAAFRTGKPVVRMRKTTSRLKRGAAAAVVGLSLTASTVLLSDGPYQTPQMEHSAFVVSFKHAGDVVTSTTTEQVDDSDVLPHMRRERPVERIRVPVRLRITVDDSVHVLESFNPGGLFDDGLSVGISELEFPVGIHSLTVEIDNTSDAGSWAYEWSGDMPFDKAQRRVLVFDEDGRFVLH
ncbi:MAG: hypothetical protein P8H65_01910 [Rhodothermales bacterium]|nr:hypothetical protein [Rhodothermales bacterium]MDG2017021.1 hypothetical protein [Rhodothermales bacterium]